MIKVTNPIANIEYMLNNGCTLKPMIQECNLLIADYNVKDKKKLEIINKVYLAIHRPGKINYVVSKEFAHLYKNLSILVTKNKHKISCLEKAKELLLKVINQSTTTLPQEVEEVGKDLDFVTMLLSKYENGHKALPEASLTLRSLSEKLPEQVSALMISKKSKRSSENLDLEKKSG